MTDNNTVNRPVVSVIMPVYNTEDLMRQSIDSVLSQTLKDIELICVDDGSTDSSLAILEEYSKNDPRVRVFCQENAGAGKARNKAIGNATGKYLAFMDADDRYPDEEVLQKLVSAAERHSVKIAGGSKLRETKKGIIPKKTQTFEKEEVIEYRDFQKDYDYQCYIFDRQMLKENGIDFPYYRRYQDPPFFIRAMLAAGRFAAIPDPTYIYKVYPSHVKWDETRTVDLIHAITECLSLSAENSMPLLHCSTVKRLEKEYKKIIIGNCSRAVVEALLEAEKKIDAGLIRDAVAAGCEVMDAPAGDEYRLAIIDEMFEGCRSRDEFEELSADLKKHAEENEKLSAELKKTKKDLSKIKNSSSYKLIRRIRKFI